MIFSKTKTILFCDNTLWGLLNFRGDVIKHFILKGYKVVLCAPNDEDAQMRVVIPQGVDCVPISIGRTSKNPLNDILYFFRLGRVFRKFRPDYVFTYTIKPNIYGSVLSHICQCPVTAMMAGMGFAFTNKNLVSFIARSLYKLSLRYCNHLLILNKDNKRFLLEKKIISCDKIILLDGGEGVNLEKFPFFNNQSEHTTFVFIGRLLWDKGYDEFSRAAREIKKTYPEVSFELWGSLDPSYPDSVPQERIIRDESDGILTYKGFTHNISEIYHRGGIVVVLPSFYGEGLNRSLMEACASGKPIITTNIAGCRETVENGKNGFLIPIHDSKALADAMLKYLTLSDSQKEFFSHYSRLIAENKFNINKIYEIYDSLVE